MTTDSSTPESCLADGHALLFFDGVCGLCNWVVDFTLPRDSNLNFYFSPLQGETAARLLTPVETQELSSFVLLQADRRFRKR